MPSERFGAPLNACTAALDALEALKSVHIVATSRWYESAPVPASDQPWYINGVVQVETDLAPLVLLQTLHKIEAQFGRVRTVPNAPRVLDLDLLAYGGTLLDGEGGHIPHPRLENRAFVLLPLSDIAPAWVHPRTGRALAEMVAKLPKDQVCRALQ